jgi:prepilin-type N-terminal cleavage/methylation domain-containing protein
MSQQSAPTTTRTPAVPSASGLRPSAAQAALRVLLPKSLAGSLRLLPGGHAMPGWRRGHRGFTLIELMITVAVIGILVAIALPSYKNYVIRGKLVAGTYALASMRAQMEQYFQDNRTYATVSAPGIVTPCVANAVSAGSSNPFNVSCSATSDAPTATTFTLRATGTGIVAGAIYTIDQANNMTTVAFPTSWGALPARNNCWIMRKGDSC